MWTALLQAIGSFVAGAGAWVVLEFIGRPLRKFYDLRGDTIYLLAQTGNVRARLNEIPGNVGQVEVVQDFTDEDMATLKEAQNKIRDLASRFRAFAGNETYALRFALWIGYDPMKASGGLFGLSNSIEKSGSEKAFHKKTIAEALSLVDA
jgi:hypothetical protein